MRDPQTGFYPFMMAACSTNTIADLKHGKDGEEPEFVAVKTRSSSQEEKIDLAIVNTIYCLLRWYPEVLTARTSKAESKYLWRKYDEFMETNKELEIKLANTELELEKRMSAEELKAIDGERKKEEMQERRDLCKSRSDRLEINSTLAMSPMTGLSKTILKPTFTSNPH
uniref:Uncharacterized protein n=1 Tax=Ditylum brightwellii TaxID=49249 RepID=A0A7S1YY41_9STRA|mmetsp:Transcript_20269/g.30139  ORF Transcript_20269/g.30139 Transcript_20269/m.30139 type:complete len:169 (+) Transcript_20269:2-508(+)